MKRVILLLLAALMVMAGSSCGLENTGEKEAYEDITLDIKDRVAQINDARGDVRKVIIFQTHVGKLVSYRQLGKPQRNEPSAQTNWTESWYNKCLFAQRICGTIFDLLF